MTSSCFFIHGGFALTSHSRHHSCEINRLEDRRYYQRTKPTLQPNKRARIHCSSSPTTSPLPLAPLIASQLSSYKYSVPYEDRVFLWKDKYKVVYRVLNEHKNNRPCLFIHGFGANRLHFRDNLPVVAEHGYSVYALDLIGFGDSDKVSPGEIVYSLDMWKQLAVDFTKEMERMNGFTDSWVLLGNSIGSLICLMTAKELKDLTASESDGRVPRVDGIVMYNCAGGLTSFRYSELPWYAAALIYVIKGLVFNSLVGPSFFERFRTPENIKQVLKQVYENPERVDDELVSSIYLPSNDPNACSIFLYILGKADSGPNPKKLLADLEGLPMIAIWGKGDPWTPLSDTADENDPNNPGSSITKYPGKMFPTWCSSLTLEVVKAKHCPFDDDPETVNSITTKWLLATAPPS